MNFFKVDVDHLYYVYFVAHCFVAEMLIMLLVLVMEFVADHIPSFAKGVEV